jgi:hypothetical protein
MSKLPFTTPREDISNDVIGTEQMSATRHSPAEVKSTVNIPLFLIIIQEREREREG